MTTSAFRVLLTLFVASGTVAAAQDRASVKLIERERKVKDVVDRVAPSVVALSDGRGWGSGVIVSNDGLILNSDTRNLTLKSLNPTTPSIGLHASVEQHSIVNQLKFDVLHR